MGERNQLVVDQIRDGGEISYWNANNPTQALKGGDIILAINGVRGDPAALVTEMERTDLSNINFTIMRKSKEFTARIRTQDGSSLGLRLDCDDEKTLKITAVSAGLIEDYNNSLGSTNFGAKIMAGDRIMSVNNKQGKAAMAEMGMANNMLEIRLLRDA